MTRRRVGRAEVLSLPPEALSRASFIPLGKERTGGGVREVERNERKAGVQPLTLRRHVGSGEEGFAGGGGDFFLFFI
jgi:hypothetical protein